MIDASGTAIVGGHGQIPVAEMGVEVVEVVGRGARGLFGIHAIVGGGSGYQAVFRTGVPLKLPDAYTQSAGNRARLKSGLGLSQKNEFLGNTLLRQHAGNHRPVTAGLLQTE